MSKLEELQKECVDQGYRYTKLMKEFSNQLDKEGTGLLDRIKALQQVNTEVERWKALGER